MKKLNGESLNIINENIRALARLFPEAVAEGKVDFEILRQLLGDSVETEREHYSFIWNGKSDARRLSQTSSLGTLRPCKEQSKNWDTTQNLYIEGDNLEVLKLLQKSYYGKVKMIYIDPPYNTGNDFVYSDDFKDGIDNYKRVTGQIDGNGRNIATNPESNGRFHTDWLNMIYPRLRLARTLLAEDGVIFISIDDHEQANLKKVCDEIFGENNFVAQLIWKSKSGGANDSRYFAVDHEYILAYAKTAEKLFLNLDGEAMTTTSYNRSDERGEYSLERLDKQSIRYSAALDFEIIAPDGKSYFPKHRDPKRPNATWRWSKDTVAERYNELVFENGNVYTKNYKKDGAVPRSLLLEDRFGRTRTGKTDFFALFNDEYFSNPKPIKLIKFLLSIVTDTDEDSIVMDFFSGSATTAHAVMQLNAEDGGNRKFILVQLPEPTPENSEAAKAGYKNICEIGKERIRRAGEKIKAEAGDKAPNLDVGFKVFKLDSSNLKKWNAQTDDIMQSLIDGLDNFLPGRTEFDVVYEILLKMGIELSTKIEEREVAGEKIYLTGDGSLMICLGENISLAIADELVKLHKECHSELWQAVFHDTGFASDMDKTNIKETLKTAGLKEDNFVCI